METQGPNGLYELFLLIVSIEKVARWQYETVLIIFPLELQTNTIALDVAKWRGGGYQVTTATVSHHRKKSNASPFPLPAWK